MSSRRPFLILLSTVALIASACVGSTSTDDVATEGEATGSAVETDASSDSFGDSPDDSSNDSPSDSSDDVAATETPEGEEAELVSSMVTGAVSPEIEACVVARAVGNPKLLARLVASSSNTDFADLGVEDQLSVLELAVDCGGADVMAQFVTAGFSEGSGFDPPPEMTDCFAGAISGDDGTLVMAGMIALGEEIPPSPEARGPLVGALTECVPASFMSDTIVTELAEDPSFTDAADTDCIDAAYADDNAIRPLWEALVDDPSADFDELPPELALELFLPLFNCISFGQVIAGQATADGVELSASSIDCIDVEFTKLDFFETILRGQEPDSSAMTGIVLTCLTPEELAQLGDS